VLEDVLTDPVLPDLVGVLVEITIVSTATGLPSR